MGRQRHLALLQSLLPSPTSPPARVLLLGDAGHGKTRLLSEIAARAAANGIAVLRGAAVSTDPDPLHAWRDVALDANVTLPAADVTVAPAERRWELADLLADALRARAPALVLLDDIQWAADDALWVLDRLVGAPNLAGCTFVAASRPVDGPTPGWRELRRAVHVVEVEPLSAADVADLVGGAGQPGVTPPAAPVQASAVDADLIWRRSGGNPLLVHELLRQGADARVGGVATDTLGRRLDVLGPDVATLLAVVAVAGADTPVSVLAVVTDRTPAGVAAALDDAVEADILTRDDGPRRFRHDLLAEVAADRLRTGELAAVHHRLATAWSAVDTAAGRHAAARHLVAAVPAADPAEAVDTAAAVGAELVGARAPAEATVLLTRTVDMAADHLPGDLELRSRALLALADAQWESGEIYPSMASAVAASALLDDRHDPVLRARAEIGACRHHHHFTADAQRRDRIDAVLGALAPDDSVVRAALLGRASVLATTTPSDIADGHRLADDAVAMARRLGDPNALAQALNDRYFCVVDLADVDARERAAQELIALAGTATRPDLALLGHEWLAGSRIARGDLDGADTALRDLEALAALRPTPTWSLAAMLRRIALLALRGDPGGAVALSHDAREFGSDILDPVETKGLELEHRMTVARLYGRADPRIGELHDELTDLPGGRPHPPVAFIEVRLALAAYLQGDVEAPRRALATWAPRAPEIRASLFGLPTAAVLSHLAVALRSADLAPPLVAALEPFAGRMPLENGVGGDVPTDAHLARLAALSGDVATAVARADDGVALARAMRAPPVEAQCLAILADAQAQAGRRDAARVTRDAAEAAASPVGVRLPAVGFAAPTPTTPSGDHAVLGASDARPAEAGRPVVAANGVAAGGPRDGTFARTAQGWTITCAHGEATVADAVGMGQLVRLLRSPGRELAATDLAGAPGAPPPAADLGPALDATAKRAYRQRIADLQDEIDEADAHADSGRAERARLEMEALLAELRRAVGLGGRNRPQGSGDERARVNVARTLRRAIAAIEREIPDLGAHLAVSVRTGRFCAYDPEPAARISWVVDA